jgi:tetratricopeptide (TPR) repeat protein
MLHRISLFFAAALLLICGGCNNESLIKQAGMAQKLENRKQFEQARLLYQEILTADPHYLDALLGRGRCFEGLGDTDRALADYQAVLQQNPKHIAAHMIIANLYRRLNDFGKAVDYSSRAAQLSPGEGWIRHINGVLLAQKGDLANARIELETAVKFDPNDGEFRADLGKFYEGLGERAKAQEQYTALLKLVEGLPGQKNYEDFARKKLAALAGVGQPQ